MSNIKTVGEVIQDTYPKCPTCNKVLDKLEVLEGFYCRNCKKIINK
jgi:tRNA(Ile2) C34 agmatinyltransferase TiaS